MKLIKLLCIIIVGLVITSVTFANHGLDQSLEMTKLNQDIVALAKENSLKEATLAKATSLATLETRIEQAGFKTPTRVLAVGSSVSSYNVASK